MASPKPNATAPPVAGTTPSPIVTPAETETLNSQEDDDNEDNSPSADQVLKNNSLTEDAASTSQFFYPLPDENGPASENGSVSKESGSDLESAKSSGSEKSIESKENGNDSESEENDSTSEDKENDSESDEKENDSESEDKENDSKSEDDENDSKSDENGNDPKSEENNSKSEENGKENASKPDVISSPSTTTIPSTTAPRARAKTSSKKTEPSKKFLSNVPRGMRRFTHRNDQREKQRLQAIHKEQMARNSNTPLVDVELRWLQASRPRFSLSHTEKSGVSFPSILQSPSTLAQCSSCRLFIGSREVPYTTHFPCMCVSLLRSSQLHRGSQRGDDHLRNHSQSPSVSALVAEAVAGVSVGERSHA